MNRTKLLVFSCLTLCTISLVNIYWPESENPREFYARDTNKRIERTSQSILTKKLIERGVYKFLDGRKDEIWTESQFDDWYRKALNEYTFTKDEKMVFDLRYLYFKERYNPEYAIQEYTKYSVNVYFTDNMRAYSVFRILRTLEKGDQELQEKLLKIVQSTAPYSVLLAKTENLEEKKRILAEVEYNTWPDLFSIQLYSFYLLKKSYLGKKAMDDGDRVIFDELLKRFSKEKKTWYKKEILDVKDRYFIYVVAVNNEAICRDVFKKPFCFLQDDEIYIKEIEDYYRKVMIPRETNLINFKNVDLVNHFGL